MLSKAAISFSDPLTNHLYIDRPLQPQPAFARGLGSEQQLNSSSRCFCWAGTAYQCLRRGAVRPRVHANHAAVSASCSCSATSSMQWQQVCVKRTSRAASCSFRCQQHIRKLHFAVCAAANNSDGPADAAQALPSAGAAPPSGNQQQYRRQQQHSKLLQQRQRQEVGLPQQQACRPFQTSAAQRPRRQQQPQVQQQQQQQPNQQQQPPPAQPRTRQLRQQLKLLQQQLQQEFGPQPLHDPRAFRAAATGSTALLLSLLQIELPQLLAPVSAPVTAAASGGETEIRSPEAAAADVDASRRMAKQRWLAALTDALTTISWHCKTHELLPAEAARLQELLVQQLLPALGPYMRQTRRSALARVVLALGSCHASTWPDQSSSSSSSGIDGHSATSISGHHHDGAAMATEQAGEASNSRTSSSSSIVAHQNDDAVDEQAATAAMADAAAAGHQSQPAGTSCGGAATNSNHQQQWVGLSSEQWVAALLPLLPPARLSPGALLAALQGCALHEVPPPQAWLQAASLTAYRALQQRRLDHTDTAVLLQSFAQLEFLPPAWLMHELVAQMKQQLPFFTPADLAGVLSSLQALSFRPSNTFLRVWCECSSRLLRGMTISQLAAAGGALSWAGYSPQAWWVQRFAAASQPLLPTADMDELLLLLHAVLSMRPQPPLGWLHEAFCHLRAGSTSLSLRQVADAAHVLTGLQLPASFLVHHRHWLASRLRWLGWQRLAAPGASSSSSSDGGGGSGGSSSGLSRSELLYTLYAAGKLQVAPGSAWLAAALRQLHQSLPGASPAELVASFVVFCHFKRTQQQQQQQQLQQVQPVAAKAEAEALVQSDSGGGSWVWLQECLAAAAGCVHEISDEGLLQLLLACADVGLQAAASDATTTSRDSDGSSSHLVLPAAAVAQPKQQRQQQDQEQLQEQQQQQQQEVVRGGGGNAAMSLHVAVLAHTLAGRMAAMSLVQLSRCVKALDAHTTRSTAGGRGSMQPAWFQQLLQQGRAAMAGRA